MQQCKSMKPVAFTLRLKLTYDQSWWLLTIATNHLRRLQCINCTKDFIWQAPELNDPVTETQENCKFSLDRNITLWNTRPIFQAVAFQGISRKAPENLQRKINRIISVLVSITLIIFVHDESHTNGDNRAQPDNRLSLEDCPHLLGSRQSRDNHIHHDIRNQVLKSIIFAKNYRCWNFVLPPFYTPYDFQPIFYFRVVVHCTDFRFSMSSATWNLWTGITAEKKS